MRVQPDITQACMNSTVKTVTMAHFRLSNVCTKSHDSHLHRQLALSVFADAMVLASGLTNCESEKYCILLRKVGEKFQGHLFAQQA